MKFLIVSVLVIGICSAQPQRRTYSEQDDVQQYQQPQKVLDAPAQYQEPRLRSAESSTFIPIIRFDKEQGDDGSYKSSYETGNNIIAEEEGYLKDLGPDPDAEGGILRSQVQQGQYTYTSPEGVVINVKYTADENGFHATGDHLPVAPPVSPEVQKGLDLIYAGIRAQEESDAIEAKNNPGAKKEIPLDYSGQYRP